MCLAAGFAAGDPDSYMIPRWSWASEDGAPQLRQLRDVQAWRRYVDGLKCLKPRERRLIVGRAELGYTYRQLALVERLPSADAARMALKRALVRLSDVIPEP